MDFENLLVDQDGPIVTITINRPAKLNALNSRTLTELGMAFEDCAADDEVRCVILTGAGSKAFVAGADISEINTLTANEAMDFSRHGQELMRRIEQLGKPVVAAINGFALGGGFELALACTLRLASDNAKLGLPEITLGVMPGFGGTQRVSRIAGRSVALELALTGQPMDAARAAELGLVHRVVEGGKLLEETRTLAERLARNAPIATAHILEAIDRGGDVGLGAALAMETHLFGLCCATEDMVEGTSAFLEKRKPEFRGR
ncbi:MAG: enoyl-CoA hydratase-related protein [Xanthomonadales bacterium]|nr:enoyl-CoA hydratase-related protein [Xanthomonadales bacterium]